MRTTRLTHTIVLTAILVHPHALVFAEAAFRSHPQVQASLSLLENTLSARLEQMKAPRAIQEAYRVYQHNVRLRNRVARMSDTEIQAQVTHIQNGVISMSRSPEDEELELTGEWTAVEGLGEVKEMIPTRLPDSSLSELKKEALLKPADRVLIAMGSVPQKDGSLSMIDFKGFQKKLSGSTKLNGKTYLSLLSVNMGLGMIALPFVVLATSAWGGSAAALWWINTLTALPAPTK